MRLSSSQQWARICCAGSAICRSSALCRFQCVDTDFAIPAWMVHSGPKGETFYPSYERPSEILIKWNGSYDGKVPWKLYYFDNPSINLSCSRVRFFLNLKCPPYVWDRIFQINNTLHPESRTWLKSAVRSCQNFRTRIFFNWGVNISVLLLD